MIQLNYFSEKNLLTLRCTLPNLKNVCLNKSTKYKFYPFFESDKDKCEKVQENLTGCISLVFTQKAVVDETVIKNSSNRCKSKPALPKLNVSIDANRTVHEMGV